MQSLREEVKRIARAAELDVVTRWVREGRLLFTNRPRAGVKDLAANLVPGFVPEFRERLRALDRSTWYHRPAWDALALALVELLHRAPRAAAALGTAHIHRLPRVAAFLARRERELCPLTV